MSIFKRQEIEKTNYLLIEAHCLLAPPISYYENDLILSTDTKRQREGGLPAGLGQAFFFGRFKKTELPKKLSVKKTESSGGTLENQGENNSVFGFSKG